MSVNKTLKIIDLDDLSNQDEYSVVYGIAKSETQTNTSEQQVTNKKKSKFFYLSLASSIIVILFLFSLYLSNLPKLYSLLIGVIAEAINCFLFYIYIVRKQMKSVGVIAMFILSTCFAILIISILLSTNV